MAQSLILTGANIVVYINNKIYKVTQSISLTVDYGEQEIYGIDAPYAQEIAGTKMTVRGSIQGLRIKQSGGIQSQNLRPLFTDFAASSYISLRIHDTSQDEDIVFIPNCKIVRETHSVAIKGTYKLNFDFAGQIPYFALDRS